MDIFTYFYSLNCIYFRIISVVEVTSLDGRYVVDEDVGEMQFEVKVTTGMFQFNILLEIETAPGSATGECI